MALCTILDLGSVALFAYVGTPFSLAAIQIMAGLAGMAVFAFVIIRRGTMPAPVPVLRGPQPKGRALYRLAIAGTIAAIIASTTSSVSSGTITSAACSAPATPSNGRSASIVPASGRSTSRD
ncbi:hypothetical protein LTR94_034414, partial [Friedmanniomyces endolithicus]